MADLDAEQRQVIFRIAVLGGVSQRFIELLNLTDGQLELAEVAGYRPRLVFQAFSGDPFAADVVKDGSSLEELIPSLDALVLTDDFAAGSHYSSAVIEQLAKTLATTRPRIPSAIFGGPALAEEWQSLSGTPVLHVGDPRGDDAMSVVKALVKALLRSNLRSTPPPPSAR